MLRTFSNRLAGLGGAAVLLVMAAAPASASGICPGSRVAAFLSPDVTLTPDSSQTIWSSPVTVLAFCEDLSNPNDVSMPLANILVSGASLISANTVPDLQASVSADGNGAYQSVPTSYPGATFTLAGVATDSSGHATFVMRAKSATQPNLGGPNGAAQLIGLHLEYSVGRVGGPISFVMPDQGLVFAGQTPELDSALLFGTGVLGMASYVAMRMRARRRH